MQKRNPYEDEDELAYELEYSVEAMIEDTVHNPEHMVEILEAATEIELSGLAVALCNMMQNDRPSLHETYAARVAEAADTLVSKACIAAAAYEDECNGK